MFDKYCIYCVTLIITILFINMSCYSSNKLLLEEINQDSPLPLSVQISNKYFSENEEPSGDDGDSPKIVPAMLKYERNEKILQVLNNEEVKRFLQKLPLGVLKQLNIVFNMDEYNGYCYLIKLFKYYNKSWTKDVMPLKNCVVKDDDEIFGQYIFDSQKLDKNSQQDDLSQNYIVDKHVEPSKISNAILLNNQQKFTSTTTIKPIRHFSPSSTSGPMTLRKKTEESSPNNPEKKFKLYLKNIGNTDFKIPPFENGSFNPSFAVPVTHPRSSAYNYNIGRDIRMSQDVQMPIQDNYQVLQDSQQVILTPQRNAPWTMQALSPPATRERGRGEQMVNNDLNNLKYYPSTSTPFPPHLIQQLRDAILGGKQDNFGRVQNLNKRPTLQVPDKNQYLSSNTNTNIQSLYNTMHSSPPGGGAPEESPITYGSPVVMDSPDPYLHLQGTVSPYIANAPSQYQYHSHAHTPIPPVQVNPYGPTGHAYTHAHHQSYGHHAHAPSYTYSHPTNSLPSWLANLFHGYSNNYGPSKVLLDLSISILPFLAFGGYIILLLLQTLTTPRFAIPVNNRTTIVPLFGRSFIDADNDGVFNGINTGRSPVQELESKVRSILLSSDFEITGYSH